MTASREDLIVEVVDGVGTITINRPHAKNAVTRAMSDQLAKAAHSFERDPAVRAVLIRGAGDDFTAGGDVKGFHADATADRAAYSAGMEQRIVNGHMTMHRLRRMPKPVIVAAQGLSVGLGVSLVCCADLAMAADDATFMLAYRHIGLSTDGGVSYFLPRIVGERRAMEITLLGERFGADKALDWGLVNWVVPKAELADRAAKLARDLAAGPTVAMGTAKRLIRRSLEAAWDEQSAAEAAGMGVTAGSDDHLEGITAFVEKRKSRFTGK